MKMKYGGNIVRTAWSHMDHYCVQGDGIFILEITF